VAQDRLWPRLSCYRVWRSQIPRSAHTVYLYAFVDLRTNSDYFHINIGFCNRDVLCLLRRTDWIFIHNFDVFMAQWPLYVAPVSHSQNLRHAHTCNLCVLYGSQNKQRLFPLCSINWLICITEAESVYCEVRNGYLYINLPSAHTVYVCVLCGSENKQRLFPYTTLTF
jgi:hypothetical protein